MLGVLAMPDFRDTEMWDEARFLVCALLEWADSWSGNLEYRGLAKTVNRLSVALLDDIAQGCGPRGEVSFFTRAHRSIDELEQTIRISQERGALQGLDSVWLNERLSALKQLLANSVR